MVVPALAGLRGRTAALVKNGEAVEIREIKVGPNNDKMAVIDAGLAEGDEILLYEPKALPEIIPQGVGSEVNHVLALGEAE